MDSRFPKQHLECLMSKNGKVVTIAALRAADAMGLTTKCLSAVLGLSEPTVLRMKAGRFLLDPGSQPYELAVRLIRLFRSLEATVGGDSKVLRQWLINPNPVLCSKPLNKLQTVTGLTDTRAYLDARRAPVATS